MKVLYNLYVVNKQVKSLKVNKKTNIKTNKITLILIKLKFMNKTKVKSKDKTL
jgi:hypothetical protein